MAGGVPGLRLRRIPHRQAGREHGDVLAFCRHGRSCGPVTFELQRGPIVLYGSRRIFASVRVTGHGLQGHLNLARQLATGRRIRKVEPFTKRLFYHAYVVGSVADLDEEFGLWLCEARAIGDGAHLAPGQ